MSGTDEAVLPPDAISFDVRVESDLGHAHKALQRALQLYKDEKKGPTYLAVQSTVDPAFLRAAIPLIADFPQVRVHIQDVEDLYGVMDWQKVGARALVRHYLNSEKVLDLMTEQSRYFHLPVGNMPADPALLGADLFYARNLAKHNHVLWCSPGDRPDLGGAQETDSRLLADGADGPSEACNAPGWYSSVCVELDVDSLAVNTLLQAHRVAEAEGASAATAFDAATPEGAAAPYDETARCAEAFRVLRAMAGTWMRDISLYRNVFADFQVVHLYRWLRSPKALLYDPALLRTLQNLMRKLFLQLVAEFKRLGCTIVYANLDKIVVCSKKRSVEDAIANVEYVVTSIRNKELFHSLEITYRQCWEHLVWLDAANFAGIQGRLPEGLRGEANGAQNDEGEEEEEDDESGPAVVMNWNLAERLPETGGCRNNFSAVIAGYINAVYTKMKAKETTTIARAVLSQPSLGLGSDEDVAEYAKEILSGEISQKLFQVTERINNRLKPLPDGSSPALEFVKAVCQVLGLDSAIKDTVDHLKGNLLRLIGVGEFSEKADWKDHSVSYVVPQVICKACNHCRDIDLGRDQYRSDSAWLCPLCNSPYDNSEMELFLLDTINRKLLAYNLQDLQCRKCAQIKMENLIMRCQCAGEFKCLIAKTDLVKLIETFQTLAHTFNMLALSETTSQILGLVE